MQLLGHIVFKIWDKNIAKTSQARHFCILIFTSETLKKGAWEVKEKAISLNVPEPTDLNSIVKLSQSLPFSNISLAGISVLLTKTRNLEYYLTV